MADVSRPSLARRPGVELQRSTGPQAPSRRGHQADARSPRLGALGMDVGGAGARPVAEIQRARLIAAAGQAVCERGAANITVAHVVERAGVSRRTFYEIFADADDCLLATLRAALDRAAERLLPIWRSQAEWRERVRQVLTDLVFFLDEEPVAGRLLLVESLGGARPVLDLRSQVLGALTAAVQEGGAAGSSSGRRIKSREARSGAAKPGAAAASAAEAEVVAWAGDTAGTVTAEGVVGGVLAVLHSRLSQPRPGLLVDLVGPLTSMVVMPYLGAAAARRELRRPVSVPARAHDEQAQLTSDPFKDAGMRLTYRTTRVLRAVAENPGASNRLIGALAGMGDQGQISKLMGRLERIGLIANGGEGHGRGEPNAWRLTAAGRQVTNRIGVHPTSAGAAGLGA